MKTLLIGNFGSGNIGDELILSQALENYPEAVVMTVSSEFPQKFCGKELDTIPFPPTGLRSGLRYLFSSKYRKILRCFAPQNDKEIERVVFAGGGLFAIKFRACFLWFLVFLWVRKLNCRIEFLHQGVDENLGFFSRILTRFVFSRVDEITVRDEASVRAVQNICGKKVENRKDKLQSSNFNLQLKNKKKERIVLINARARFDVKILESKFEGYKKVFVVFDPSDQKFSFGLDIIYPQTRKEVLELFEKAEYAIGERLHFLILGELLCGEDKTFVLRKPYAEKVQSFCSEKGIKEYLSSAE